MNDLLTLDRDPLTFVKARIADRLGWEDTLRTGDSYSAYILKDVPVTGPQQVLTHAYRLAASVIATVTAHRVHLRLDPRENYATASRQIVISTQAVDDTRLSPHEQMDVLLGEAVHEAAHIEYTDFDLLSFPRTPKGNLCHSICNILEDERIERLIGEDHPGYSRFLEKIKYYFFDTCYQNALPDYGAMTDSQKLFSLFFSLVRYPKYIRTEDLDTFAPQVLAITEVLTPYPATNGEIKTAVEKIYAILRAFHRSAPKPMPGNGSSDETKSGAGLPERTPKPPALEDELGPLAAPMNRVISSSAAKGSRKEIQVCTLIEENPAVAMVLEGVAERGSSADVYFVRQSDHEEQYRASLREVAPYASALSALLQAGYRNYEVRHKHLRHGSLDTTKLTDAYLGAATVYERKEQIASKALDVALLVDLSGSMNGTKIAKARSCAVLFNEALRKVKGINYFIYGHTADRMGDRSTDMSVYREGAYRPRYAPGSMTAQSSNRDGVAILETAKRIRKFSANPCLLFVISDGQPSASGYCHQAAVEHTRQSVKMVEEMGFTVIQIAIDSHVPSERMFTHHVKLTNLATLPRDLGALLRKVIAKMTR